MENLNLRKAVSEALGCKVGRRSDEQAQLELYICQCQGHPHARQDRVFFSLYPVDLDHHAALDALEEYARKTGFDYDIGRRGNKFKVTIYTDDGVWEVDNSLALTICKAIAEAARKSEKKEGG